MTQIMLGVRYAANETDLSRKHVVAMAFGQEHHSDLLSEEITRLYYGQDVRFIAAAGTNVPYYLWHGGGSAVVTYPASKLEVMAVSATETDGSKNPDSSGNDKVELTAFSKNTVGNYNLYGYLPGVSNSNTTTELNHSSASTTVISGVAALVRTRFPRMTNV
jgi:Subtilase family